VTELNPIDDELEEHRINLARAEELLRHTDTCIAHDEVEVEPTTLVGVRVDWGSISAIMLTLFTAFFFAWEGYLYSKVHYDPATGRAIFPQAAAAAAPSPPPA